MTTRTITIDGVLTGVWASERLAVLLGSLGKRRAIHLRANRSSVAYIMCIIGPLNSADKIFAPYRCSIRCKCQFQAVIIRRSRINGATGLSAEPACHGHLEGPALA